MFNEEPHGWQEVTGTMTMAAFLFSLIITFLSLAWFWALDKNLLTGLIVGVVAGIAFGSLIGFLAGMKRTRMERRGCASFAGSMLGGPLIILGIVGVIVGVIREIM
tara:strand:+ start:52 stop:369 length:318 start_codon:yes stop_codon:yes gene_type:complete